MGQIESIFKLKVEDQPAKFPMTDKEILDWLTDSLITLDYKKATNTHNARFILECDEVSISGSSIRQVVCDAKTYADEVNS